MLIAGGILGMLIYQFATVGGIMSFFLQFNIFAQITVMFSAGVAPGLMLLMLPLLSLMSMAVFFWAVIGMIAGRSRGYAFFYNFFAFLFFLAAGLFIGMTVYMAVSLGGIAILSIFDWILLVLCLLGMLFCWASLKKNKSNPRGSANAYNNGR
jgi:hypothetical protein